MTAKATFQVYQDAAGAWRWRLVHDNGNVLADGGQGYSSKRRAVDGIESVRQNAPGHRSRSTGSRSSTAPKPLVAVSSQSVGIRRVGFPPATDSSGRRSGVE